MNFTIIDVEQRSPEWHQARAGFLTGSVAGQIVATLKGGGEPAGRRDLRTRLALERLLQRPLEDDYLNADMRRGIEREPDARACFEAATGLVVQQSGFIRRNDLMVGTSLDGHVGDFDVIVEFKCPRPANHLKHLRSRSVGIPPEHLHQLLHGLLVTGAGEAILCSYQPDFPDPLRLFMARMPRDQAQLDAYELAVRQFLREVDDEYAEIARMGRVAA